MSCEDQIKKLKEIIALKKEMYKHQALASGIADNLSYEYFISRTRLAEAHYEYAALLEQDKEFPEAATNYLEAWELTAHSKSQQRLCIPVENYNVESESKPLPAENKNLSDDPFERGLQYLGGIGVSRNAQAARDNFALVKASNKKSSAAALLLRQLLLLNVFSTPSDQVGQDLLPITTHKYGYIPGLYYYGYYFSKEDLFYNSLASNESFPPALFREGCDELKDNINEGKRILQKAILQGYEPAIQKLDELYKTSSQLLFFTNSLSTSIALEKPSASLPSKRST